jgi:hypothetical protein
VQPDNCLTNSSKVVSQWSQNAPQIYFLWTSEDCQAGFPATPRTKGVRSGVQPGSENAAIHIRLGLQPGPSASLQLAFVDGHIDNRDGLGREQWEGQESFQEGGFRGRDGQERGVMGKEQRKHNATRQCGMRSLGVDTVAALLSLTPVDLKIIGILPSFPPSFHHSFLPSFLPSVHLSFHPSFLPSFHHSILPSFLPSFLPSILHSILSSFLPSCHLSFLSSILRTMAISNNDRQWQTMWGRAICL